jgi:hypothetical protein
MLRIDELAVDLHVKYAAAPLNQIAPESCLLPDPGRQAGGLRKVVSRYAIGNRYLHDALLPFSHIL